MSVDASATPAPTTQADPASGASPAYTPPASQAELDRIIGDRLARERAKFSDYDTVKAKADRLDAAEQAAKTEAQRLSERIAAAEARAIAADRRALAREMGVPVSAIHGDTEAAMRASAQEVLDWHAAQLKAATKAPPAPAPKPTGLHSGAAPSADRSGKESAAAALRQLSLGRR